MKKLLIFSQTILLIILFLTACGNAQQDKEEKPANARLAMREAEILMDDAALLGDDPKFMKSFYDINRNLLKQYDIDFRVVTTQSQEDIDRQANRLFNRLQQKSRSCSGKALLLLINPIQDRVRLEVSQALEPIYTDAFVSYLERKGMVPYFRDNKVADGAFMMMELIHDRANDAQAGKEFVPPMASRSIGGGAKSAARIGKADPQAKKGAPIEVGTGESPEKVLRKYLQSLKTHNRNPDLEIYTKATREFFRKHTVTTINQDNEVRFLAPCLPKQTTLYGDDGEHAVIAALPYDKHRTCSPYFFKKEEGKWRLDIATMARMLRFNTQMAFHFDPRKRLQGEGIYYAYAFDGYAFDANGYPYTPRKKMPEDSRWGFRCGTWFHPRDKENVKREPKKYYRCGIVEVWRGSPAEVRLGLRPGDYIYAVGEGSDRIDNATYVQFMDYMKRVLSGTRTVVTVRVNHGEEIVRRGIAP